MSEFSPKYLDRNSKIELADFDLPPVTDAEIEAVRQKFIELSQGRNARAAIQTDKNEFNHIFRTLDPFQQHILIQRYGRCLSSDLIADALSIPKVLVTKVERLGISHIENCYRIILRLPYFEGAHTLEEAVPIHDQLAEQVDTRDPEVLREDIENVRQRLIRLSKIPDTTTQLAADHESFFNAFIKIPLRNQTLMINRYGHGLQTDTAGELMGIFDSSQFAAQHTESLKNLSEQLGFPLDLARMTIKKKGIIIDHPPQPRERKSTPRKEHKLVFDLNTLDTALKEAVSFTEHSQLPRTIVFSVRKHALKAIIEGVRNAMVTFTDEEESRVTDKDPRLQHLILHLPRSRAWIDYTLDYTEDSRPRHEVALERYAALFRITYQRTPGSRPVQDDYDALLAADWVVKGMAKAYGILTAQQSVDWTDVKVFTALDVLARNIPRYMRE